VTLSRGNYFVDRVVSGVDRRSFDVSTTREPFRVDEMHVDQAEEGEYRRQVRDLRIGRRVPIVAATRQRNIDLLSLQQPFRTSLRIAECNAGSRDRIVQRSLANLREVSAILDTKAPADAGAFKAWLRGISEKVAEAAAEGGFLSFGGVQVSDAEKATLADIAKALGTTA